MAKKNGNRETQTITKEDAFPPASPSPEPVKENLPAVIAPPSLLAIARNEDEVSSAFLDSMKDQSRDEVPGIPMISIDHPNHCFAGGASGTELYGYIVHWFQARAWWKQGYKSGDSNPPDCWSPDMHQPSPASALKQASTCHGCKWAQFGSTMGGQGRGQACKVNTFIFLLNSEFGTPPVACLILPPSSIRPLMGVGRVSGYLQAVKNFRDPETGRQARFYELVWTRFSLEPGGDRHDLVRCDAVAVCRNADEARAIAAIRKQFMAAMDHVRGDVVSEATGGE